MAGPKVNYLTLSDFLADQTDEFDTAISLKAIECVVPDSEFVIQCPGYPMPLTHGSDSNPKMASPSAQSALAS